MGDVLATLTDLGMTAVSSVVTATGSLIVGLALMADVILPDTAADISILDEGYQMERWGKDKNVSDRHDQIRKEICLAYRLLRTLQLIVSDQFFLDRISIVIYKYLNHKS